MQFLRGLSNSVLNKYVGERMVLGEDLNCAMNQIDKRGGRSFEQKKTVIQEMKTLMRTHNLIDTWSYKHPNKQAFTWNNPSKKIYCITFLFQKAWSQRSKMLKSCLTFFLIWVKRLCANEERPWKFIPLSLLSNVGGSLLFRCNYNIQYLPLNENLPKFYRDVISHWQKINNTNPKTKGDVLNQIIWNNQFFRVNKSSVFFPSWKKVGIENLSCFFDNESNTLMTFTTFMQKYNVKSNFLQYYSLLSAIPQEWKTMLKQECLLLSTAEGRLIEHGFIFQERQKIYSLPFRVTNEVKLSVFQYKIIHNIVYTNKLLHKMKKKQQPDCPYCHGIDQTPLHLFVECAIAKSFWNKFTKWYSATCGKNIALE